LTPATSSLTEIEGLMCAGEIATLNRNFTGAAITSALRQSAPANAIHRTSTIHRSSRTHGLYRNRSRDRPRPQHDAGPYDAADGILDVLAVHHSTGFFGACNYAPSYQQR
jgi:hypothetical protein